jgi:hypothetical protein
MPIIRMEDEDGECAYFRSEEIYELPTLSLLSRE